MSYNYNFGRHNSVGGSWNLPPQFAALSPARSLLPNPELSQSVMESLADYRSPWYPSPLGNAAPEDQLKAGNSFYSNLSPSPNQYATRLAPKRLSFAAQLPTTYEATDAQQIGFGATFPAVHAPPRAGNPFPQYGLNDNWLPPTGHRRTSVAGDMPYAPYPPHYQDAPHAIEASLRDYRVSAPYARQISTAHDLRPKSHAQPKFRRCSVHQAQISPANALLLYLSETYQLCQPHKFQYSKVTNPRRVLTKPLDPVHNHGLDNEDSDYILYVNDVLGTEEGRKYMVLDLLGSGTFGQVVKCQNLSNQLVCAVKIIKLKPAYLNQLLTEVRILEYLKTNSDCKYFVTLQDTFLHKEHLCLVFELLTSNLYELIKQNQYHGLSMKLVKLITRQLLNSLAQLKDFQMIHCDLKPENILLCLPDKADIKVIDFGLACFARQTVYTYIQLRFYRLPEVILGLPYTALIDMWLLGCVVAELFLGLPLLPGLSEYNQMWKIVAMMGMPPKHMLDVGRNTHQYFSSVTVNGKSEYKMKEYAEYCDALKARSPGTPCNEQPDKNYHNDRVLRDIIYNYKMPSRKMQKQAADRELRDRHDLIDFLIRVLNLNPLARLTPQEALKHPFVTG